MKLLLVGIFGVVWLLLVVFGILVWGVDRVGPLGDALGPLGSIVNVGALLFALDQYKRDQERHETENTAAQAARDSAARDAEAQRKQDADRDHRDRQLAHLDQLAHAYAKWFTRAWERVEATHQALSKVDRNVVSSIPPAIEQVNIAVRGLHIPAVEVLMLDRDDARKQKIKATWMPFPVAPNPDPLDAGRIAQHWRTVLDDNLAELRNRQAILENVYDIAGNEIEAERMNLQPTS